LTRAVSIYALLERNNYIQKKEIPLSKGKSDIKISYISGVALHFSNTHNSDFSSIASSIAYRLSEILGGYFIVEALPTGLIQIQVTDSVLAVWLQSFIDSNGIVLATNSSELVMSEPSDCVFPIQYIHARCCSLLRLAHQEKLVDLNKTSSGPIPWLNDDREIRLNHQAERCLIYSLVRFMDELNPVNARRVKWEGLALPLVRAFEGFCSSCRIHDGLKLNAPELVMARIGLLMATQSVLRFVLEEKLGTTACWEL